MGGPERLNDGDEIDRLLARDDVEKCDQCEAILDHPGYCEMCFQLVWLEWKAKQVLDGERDTHD